MLIVNRYGNVTPSAFQSNGVVVSTPIYVALTKEQNKAILNAVRDVAKEGSIDVEEELGVNEENLRHLLFSSNGIPERLLVKLQALTGIDVVTREQIEKTYTDWCDYLFD